MWENCAKNRERIVKKLEKLWKRNCAKHCAKIVVKFVVIFFKKFCKKLWKHLWKKCKKCGKITRALFKKTYVGCHIIKKIMYFCFKKCKEIFFSANKLVSKYQITHPKMPFYPKWVNYPKLENHWYRVSSHLFQWRQIYTIFLHRFP